MKGCQLLLSFLLVLVLPGVAAAHKPSDSYLRITGGGANLTAQWDISLRDLEFVIGLDNDLNGEITWGEVKTQRSAISAYALSRLEITADEHDCKIQVVDLMVNEHSDGTYVVLDLAIDGSGKADLLEVYYNLLFEIDPTHRGLVLYNNENVSSTHVLGPDDQTVVFRTSESGLFRAFVEYTKEGVWHIWIGFDHILFLICLLLPAVWNRDKQTWQPVQDFTPAVKGVLKIVTCFTLAHSITLWLAVMDYVRLPGRFIEATIAFSIVVTALNNFYPLLRLSGCWIAFAFGLVHGFGFANVLMDLGLSNATLAVSLFGFNVGVELGQLAIVFVFFPIAFQIRSTAFYRLAVFRVGTILIASVAVIWMYERIFVTEILGI